MNDIDEYLVIKNDTLKNYLSNKIFNHCDFIRIHLIQPTDNNILYYEKKPLFERFKGPYIYSKFNKYFVRGNIKRLYYYNDSQSSPLRNISCNNLGKISVVNDLTASNYEKAIIIHYKYKSTEEFINKLRRDYSKWFDFNFLQMRIQEYFTDNEINLEKVNYIEKQLKLDLNIYKKKFQNIIKINESSDILNTIHNKKQINNRKKKI